MDTPFLNGYQENPLTKTTTLEKHAKIDDYNEDTDNETSVYKSVGNDHGDDYDNNDNNNDDDDEDTIDEQVDTVQEDSDKIYLTI